MYMFVPLTAFILYTVFPCSLLFGILLSHMAKLAFLSPVLFSACRVSCCQLAVAKCKSFPGVGMNITPVCVHADERYRNTCWKDYRSRVQVFQDPIWYTVWVWGLYNLDVPHGLQDLIAAVEWGSVAGEKCKIHRPRQCLNHCGFRRIIYRLKPSIVTIIQDLAAYSEFDRAASCGVRKAVS